MRVLVVGSGAREHALCWRLKLSPNVTDIWVAAGNSGTARIADNVPVSPEDVDGLANLASQLKADLVVVGPEQPLVDGLVDRLAGMAIPAFGPSTSSAQLEASKSFARQVMADAGVPGPDYRVFHDSAAALEFVENHSSPLVIKADGLAAGKGVALCSGPEEAALAVKGCMGDRIFGTAGDTIVVEEWLQGTEVSVFAFCDGERLSAPVAACDYKQVGDGDQGPNTGGMGSFAPPPFWNSYLSEQICRTILEPTVARMAEIGCPYRGMLYAGLMLTSNGPKVLEFNCRFGDPETQVILPLLESDPVEVMQACISGNLAQTPVQWGNRAHVGVVMVSGGYPGAYETGKEITGLEAPCQSTDMARLDADHLIFHAGAAQVTDESGVTRTLTSGGRVLTVVGRGQSIDEARVAAYRKVEQIHFKDARYRLDIGDLSSGSRSGL
ncbi:MAG: phosphoribosylamine--glycine ligase [Chloroflexota bacterium]|nr:phosphoribosylamine--glycine ligase [Chloroflexota bacterium]